MCIINDIKITVLGGDLRQIYAAETLAEKGYNVSVYGLENKSNINENDVYRSISESKIVLLPLPFSTDKIRVNCPLSSLEIKLDDLCNHFYKNQIIAGGKLTDSFCKKAKSKGAFPFDYYKSERLNVLNAVPTAEGAVGIAISELKTTVFSSKCAVVGYGRIGKVLAKTLKALGADVTVFARSESALAWAEADGLTAINICYMKDHIFNKQILFNTVPALVINSEIIDNTLNDVLLVDLASAPGGIDTDYAKNKGRKVIFALSLPGKVAPQSSGVIIANTVLSHCAEVIK